MLMKPAYSMREPASIGSLLIVLCVLVYTACIGSACASAAEQNANAENAWSVELKLKNYFSSHTSYEFGNPDPPYQAPLSLLEFPMNNWWVGFEARKRFPRFSAGIEVMRNFTRESDGLMKDSDWTDDARPEVRTIYSEWNCRMDPSYSVRGDLDVKISDWIGLPDWIDLRPVVGMKWQRLRFAAHDGSQWAIAGDVYSQPGDIITFEQTYWHYFLGIRADYDLGRHLGIPRLRLQGQLDWARVEGKNIDQHLSYLERGINRFTYENTSGHAWHATGALKYGYTKAWSAKLELDYLKIETTGSHEFQVNDSTQTWENGVKVWSEQFSVMLGLEYTF